MDDYSHIIEQWQAGKPAPFALYEATNFLHGTRELVEAMGGGAEPVIRAGEPIPAEIAERVRAQHAPAQRDPIRLHVLELDEHGEPRVDEDGHAITREELVEQTPEVKPFSFVPPTLAHEDDWHCDMCGVLAEPGQLYRIGDGWYCKRPRAVAGRDQPMTCFAVRIEQMRGAR